MKITTFDKSNITGAYISQAKKGQPVTKDCLSERGHTVSTECPQLGDSLQISQTAREINKYQGELKKIPVIRAEKVLELQKSIQQNTYQPSAQKISAAIIAGNHLDQLV